MTDTATLLLPAKITRPVSRWQHLTPDQRRALEFMAADDLPVCVATGDNAALETFNALWQLGAISTVYRNGNTDYHLTRRGRALLATRDGGEVCPKCGGVKRGWHSFESVHYPGTCDYAYWECDLCNAEGIIPPEPVLPLPIMAMVRSVCDSLNRYAPVKLVTDEDYISFYVERFRSGFIPAGIREALEEAGRIEPRRTEGVVTLHDNMRTVTNRDRYARAARKSDRARWNNPNI